MKGNIILNISKKIFDHNISKKNIFPFSAKYHFDKLYNFKEIITMIV